MALSEIARVLSVFSLLCLPLCFVTTYEIPEVQIQALKPKGIRVSIPDAPKLGLFAFQGNLNRHISNTDSGTISGEVLSPTNGLWVFEDRNVQLKIGDVLHYYVFVSVDSAGYIKDNLRFQVRALEDPSGRPATNNPLTVPTNIPIVTMSPNGLSHVPCWPSSTIIRGGSVCSGKIIFEDNFETLREDIWQIEQYIPVEHPEFPFNSYQRSAVSVSRGKLRIAPSLQQDMPGFNSDAIHGGDLDLINGCTGSANECVARASGASILPPVVSGRITSKGLTFTYGIVHIRAKFPQGDWLYPELLLEPFRKKYGNMYASGILNIARARGNKDLNFGINTVGNKNLYGGPIMDRDCRDHLITKTKLEHGMWGDDFHVYSVVWTPVSIILLVDNQEWAKIDPTNNGLQGRFPPTCRNLPRNFLATGSKMAPFDDHFYITLGVAAGGITEFSDDLLTQNHKTKPWRNQARKASLHFWQDLASWFPTWDKPELLVDYVKVVAL